MPRGAGYRDRLADGGGYDENHLVALRKAGEVMATRRNVEGGFWVAEADPDAAHYAIRATWPRDEVTTILMASDGVSCGVTPTASSPTGSDVRDVALAKGPEAVLDRVRAAESEDPPAPAGPAPNPTTTRPSSWSTSR